MTFRDKIIYLQSFLMVYYGIMIDFVHANILLSGLDKTEEIEIPQSRLEILDA